VPPLYDYAYSADQAAKFIQLVVLKLAAHIQALQANLVSVTDTQHKIFDDLHAALIHYGRETIFTHDTDHLEPVETALEALIKMK
jgi:hypothetical protein